MTGIVELFAGPGGWSEGLRMLGRHDAVGVEWDHDACATAAAAGHKRVQADVAAYPPAAFADVEGLIASPPCTAFSLAGKGGGRELVPQLLEAIQAGDWTGLREHDPTVWLPLEVGRWVNALRPRWVACEQVPQALPLWEAYADVFRRWGYDADCRVLMAADFGVPQTRQRAFLVARGGRVRWPEPTHFGNRRRKNQPDLFGSPWVTVADALDWSEQTLIDRRQNSSDGRGGSVPVALVPASRPAPTLTTQSVGQWVFHRPAPTIIGTTMLAAPGHRCMSDDCCGKGRTSHFDEDAITISISEAGVLQSFPADYPWYGNKQSCGKQVGNAVPPLLAAHVLSTLLDVEEVAA